MPMHCLHECFTLKELCELSKSWPLRVQPNKALFRGNILAWRVITVWLLQKYRLETAHCIFSPQHGADNRHWNWVLSHWLVNLPWRIFPQIQDQFYEAFFFLNVQWPHQWHVILFYNDHDLQKAILSFPQYYSHLTSTCTENRPGWVSQN